MNYFIKKLIKISINLLDINKKLMDKLMKEKSIDTESIDTENIDTKSRNFLRTTQTIYFSDKMCNHEKNTKNEYKEYNFDRKMINNHIVYGRIDDHIAISKRMRVDNNQNINFANFYERKIISIQTFIEFSKKYPQIDINKRGYILIFLIKIEGMNCKYMKKGYWKANNSEYDNDIEFKKFIDTYALK